jgi:hypothetical protein
MAATPLRQWLREKIRGPVTESGVVCLSVFRLIDPPCPLRCWPRATAIGIYVVGKVASLSFPRWGQIT